MRLGHSSNARYCSMHAARRLITCLSVSLDHVRLMDLWLAHAVSHGEYEKLSLGHEYAYLTWSGLSRMALMTETLAPAS